MGRAFQSVRVQKRALLTFDHEARRATDFPLACKFLHACSGLKNTDVIKHYMLPSECFALARKHIMFV